jgi:CHAT domain-containing protein/tetratricopeptide (TPR) repeat protein
MATRLAQSWQDRAITVFRTDSATALQMVMAAHQESGTAFRELLGASPDNAVRRELHQRYREKTAHLLELLRLHNESPMRLPQPWDLTIIAQPLVQQTLIEADIVDALGEPGEATSLREWAVEIASNHLPALAFARIRRSIAVQRASEGRFNEALTEFEDVRQLFADEGDVIQSAQTALEKAALLEWLGDDERALQVITAAGTIMARQKGSGAPEIEDHAIIEEENNLRLLGFRDKNSQLSSGGPDAWFHQVARALALERQSIAAGRGATGEADRVAAYWRVSVELIEHAARVHKARGEYDLAADLWESVLPDYETLGDASAIEYQLAGIDRARGRFAEARERLKRIEPAFAIGLLSGKVAGLRLLESMVALGLNEPANALRLADEGIAELQNHGDDDLAWRLYWRKGQSLRAMDRSPEALAAYATAAAFVDSLRKSPLGYRLDSMALRAKLPLVEEAIVLAANRGDAASCLRFIEIIKARALSSALSVPAALRTRRSDLEVEFDRVTQRLDALEYQGYSGAAGGAKISEERTELLARRIELMEQIRLRDPRWRGLTAPPPFDPTNLAAALKKRGQAALTLHLHDGIVISVLVVNGRFEVGQQALDPDVAEILDEYAANLIKPAPDRFRLDPADLHLDAAKLVPADLLEKALSSSSLLVAPHGLLHLLPWASLPFGEKRLFERTAVGLVPNLSCALALDYEPAKEPRAAIAGAASYPELSQIDYLPFTAVEIKDLSALYAGRLVAPPLVDEAATETAVRELATRDDAGSAILHLSCHGTLSVEDPLGSGVLLSDGKIDAAEWAQMRLHYDEVVLSACSTGWRPQTALGIPLHGDDVLGLPGALLEAGARSIVVSIPKAEDETTAAFMTAYHGRRAAGKSPLVAFCLTQRELLASKHEPYTWSGLVCYSVR